MRVIISLVFFQLTAFVPRWEGQRPVGYCCSQEAQRLMPEIRYAAAQWQRAGGPAMYETADCGAWRTIAIRLQNTGSLYGGAFYPHPLFPEPIAGDVMLNERMPWLEQAHPLLVPTLVHEIGHGLGMTESFEPDSIMNPAAISPLRPEPSAADSWRIRCLYQGVCR